MKYRNLGKSGLEVSEVGLGCNNFGRRWDYERAKTIIGGALDNGINFLDTADVYSDGESESIIGRALHGIRDQVVIGTKFAGAMGEGPNSSGGSRKYLIDALDASLRRLQTDYVDLYQMHGPDRSTPIHETLRALDDMVTAGKVRYIGCSNFPGWEIVDAVWTSRTERMAHFVSCQPPYNILDRGIEAEILPACRRYGLGILPYYPLASGFLTGKYDQGNAPPEGTRLHFFPNIAERHLTEEKFASLGRLQEFARATGPFNPRTGDRVAVGQPAGQFRHLRGEYGGTGTTKRRRSRMAAYCRRHQRAGRHRARLTTQARDAADSL